MSGAQIICQTFVRHLSDFYPTTKLCLRHLSDKIFIRLLSDNQIMYQTFVRHPFVTVSEAFVTRLDTRSEARGGKTPEVP